MQPHRSHGRSTTTTLTFIAVLAHSILPCHKHIWSAQVFLGVLRESVETELAVFVPVHRCGAEVYIAVLRHWRQHSGAYETLGTQHVCTLYLDGIKPR